MASILCTVACSTKSSSLKSELYPNKVMSRKINSSVHFPSFGTSSTPLEEVLQFYNVWSVFTTLRTFASVCQYDTREAPNRFVRRAMEKKNNKSKEDARRQYNQTVQRLVELVKRFDPRYQEAKEAHEQEQKRMEEERNKRREEEKRRREEDLRQNMEARLTQVGARGALRSRRSK